MSLTRPTRCFERQATAVYLFTGFFGLGVLAFEVGEGHVQRFVTQPDADNVYSTAWGNFSVADDPFSAAAGHVTWLKPLQTWVTANFTDAPMGEFHRRNWSSPLP
jgi:hypothetical protein